VLIVVVVMILMTGMQMQMRMRILVGVEMMAFVPGKGGEHQLINRFSI